MLIIICGLPGTGKTTVAKKIAGKLHAQYFSSDTTRKSSIPNPSYTEEERMSVYDTMAESVEKALSKGRNVVVDATFYKKEIRSRYLHLASKAGTRSYIVLCVLPEKEIEKRIISRKGGHSDADFSVYLKLKGSFEPIDKEHLTISSDLPLRERVDKIEKYVGENDG